MKLDQLGPLPLLMVLLSIIALPAFPEEVLRPPMVAADEASGCPSVEGAFVALLDPSRGMLLLSAAPFPGGEHRDLSFYRPRGRPVPLSSQ